MEITAHTFTSLLEGFHGVSLDCKHRHSDEDRKRDGQIVMLPSSIFTKPQDTMKNRLDFVHFVLDCFLFHKIDYYSKA